MTTLDQLQRLEGESIQAGGQHDEPTQGPGSSVRRQQLIAASWHGVSALSVGLVTAALTGSFAWGAAAAAGDLILRPQLQLFHAGLVERLLRRPTSAAAESRRAGR